MVGRIGTSCTICALALCALPGFGTAEAAEVKLRVDPHAQRAHTLIRAHHGSSTGQAEKVIEGGPRAVKRELRRLVAAELAQSNATHHQEQMATVDRASLRGLVHLLETPAVFGHVLGHDASAIATPAHGAVKLMTANRELKAKKMVLALALRAQEAGLAVIDGATYPFEGSTAEADVASRRQLWAIGKELGLMIGAGEQAPPDQSAKALHSQLRESWFAKIDGAMWRSRRGKRLEKLAARATSSTTNLLETGYAIKFVLGGVALEGKLGYPLGELGATDRHARFEIKVNHPEGAPRGVLPKTVAGNPTTWKRLKTLIQNDPVFGRGGPYAGALEAFDRSGT